MKEVLRSRSALDRIAADLQLMRCIDTLKAMTRLPVEVRPPSSFNHRKDWLRHVSEALRHPAPRRV